MVAQKGMISVLTEMVMSCRGHGREHFPYGLTDSRTSTVAVFAAAA